MVVGWEWDDVLEMEELQKAFDKDGMEEGYRMLERKRDGWKDIPLNVAVIGNSGSGKSTLINTIRGLTADDEGAAEVGVTETTLDIRSYPHPNNPMLKFWDLPGVGTNKFPIKTYLRDISVERYDFFLLITADRFTENDTRLGKEFRKQKKKYFFVRTKIGADILNDQKAHPKNHNEDSVVETIRQSTADQLKKDGCDDVPIFLIDSHEVGV